MEHALLQVVHLQPHKTLLQYDAAAHREKLRRQPHPYASSSTEDRETISSDPRVVAYTDLLDFIASAQQECYALFGDDEARWSVDDGIADTRSTGTRGSSSVRVNSSDWSEDDAADVHGGGAASARKRRRQQA